MPEITHSPAHGLTCGNVIGALTTWSPCQSKGLLACNQPAVLIRTLDAGHDLRIEWRPDIIFTARSRLSPTLLSENRCPVPPDLAVEVFERADRWEEVERMVDDCLEVGVREFWVLRLHERDLRVFRHGGGSLTLPGDAELSSDLLPGFRCTVADFFVGL